jgi:AcrR family transcriptional regulator
MAAQPTPVPQPYHHGNLRTVLLEHADRSLADGGVQALSLRELARRAGVSHGAPRRHFADKQALLDALARSGFEQLRAQLEGALGQAGPDFPSRATAFATSYVRFATEHAALLELMFAAKHEPDATEGLREAAVAAFTAPLQLIADAQAQGTIGPGDPTGVATVFWASLHGLASMANTGLIPGEHLDALAAEAVERILLGLQPG